MFADGRAWRRNAAGAGAGLCLACTLTLSPPAAAQHEHHHPPAPAADTTRRPAPRAPARPRTRPQVPTRTPAPVEHHEHGSMPMRGFLGNYPLAREASGTAWQPDRARHAGVHGMHGKWTTMVHGMLDLVDDHQGGRRGDHRTFASNMVMAMAQRPLGRATLGLRAMLSAEPATIGKAGYPLLLQTGETADGRTPLLDRQHPHDLFMELAATASVGTGPRSVFLYAGLPGEPALGPPAFMHRFSGEALPAAPLSHHWLDSSHITFGVLTAGVVLERMKLEVSAFRGREPDEERWDLEAPKLDSHAIRISANLAPQWSVQVSRGRLESPEQLEPDVDVDRTTVSVMHEIEWPAVHGQATFAWGRNENRPGPSLDAVLLEAAVAWADAHVLFGRAERVEKNELFPEADPRAAQVFDVGALTLGYRWDGWRAGRVRLGFGGAGTLVALPRGLTGTYGSSPAAGLLFLHAALQ